MALITWTNNYSVNIKDMDEQHQNLVQLINGFYDALQTDTELETAPHLLDGLVEYTKTHFKKEEALLKKYQFPEYEAHKTEHDDFANKIHDAYKQFHGGDKSVIGKIALMTSGWLMDHIVMKDKKYGTYINNKRGA